MRVLILCTGNSCRSQMAAGFLASFDRRLDVHSAGTYPAAIVQPLAVAVMKEAGVDISAAFPKSVEGHLERFRLRVPLRFRPIGLASDRTEHFTEAVNLSRGGFFFVTSAPLQVGMPIEVTLRMPIEVTGTQPEDTHCKARVVHAKPDAFSDGRMGFGAEIESFIEPERPKPQRPELVKPPPSSAKLKP